MDELEQQIAAWGDATMDGSGPPVTGTDVRERSGSTSPRRPSTGGGGRRWALGAGVAAAVLALVAFATVAVGGRDAGPEEVRTSDGVGGPSVEVTFEVLATGPALMDGVGSFDVARSPGDLSEVWADAGQPPPVPIVDFDEQVVLSITIADDACPPELVAFGWLDDEVEGRPVLQPRFVEPAGGCDGPLIPKTYVVAIDWRTTGDDLWIHLPVQPDYGFDDGHFRLARGELVAHGTAKRPPSDGLSDASRLVVRAAIQASLLDSVPELVVDDAGTPGLGGETGTASFAVTLPAGTDGTLSWFEITAGRPEDPRAGLDEATTVGTDSGGVVTIGVPPDTSAALRFDCDGVRYQLAGPTGPSRLLAAVDVLASALGCERPITSAPTECLGLADDPVGCTED